MAASIKEPIILDDFQQRFIKVLESQNAKYWMINLGIQSNLLWGWKKGNYPGLRYAIEICLNEGISANWLFLGLGPQYIEDLENVDDEVLMDEALKEELLTTVMSLKKEMKEESEKNEERIKQIISDVETLKTLKTFSDVFTSSEDLINLKDGLPSNILEKIAVPILTFVGKNADEIASSIEEYATSEKGAELFKNAIRWIIDHR